MFGPHCASPQSASVLHGRHSKLGAMHTNTGSAPPEIIPHRHPRGHMSSELQGFEQRPPSMVSMQ